MARNDATSWKKPDRCPILPRGQVHVWRTALAVTPDIQTDLAGLLATDERKRAGRFVFEEHRRRFIVCRGRLRQILSSYLAASPASLRFCYEASGKPRLDGPNANSLSFNVAHSEDVALIAIIRSGSVGVDIEAIRPLTTDLWGLAKEHFSPREQAELTQIEKEQRLPAFYRGWTRKESIVKADGRGLAAALEKIEVGLDDQSQPIAVEFPPDASPRVFWRVWSFKPAAGFVGAVTTPCSVETVECFCWD
jgi:4'-phosphopantetheinyl transferase